jgi:hypothetical protein
VCCHKPLQRYHAVINVDRARAADSPILCSAREFGARVLGYTTLCERDSLAFESSPRFDLPRRRHRFDSPMPKRSEQARFLARVSAVAGTSWLGLANLPPAAGDDDGGGGACWTGDSRETESSKQSCASSLGTDLEASHAGCECRLASFLCCRSRPIHHKTCRRA